MLFVFLLNKMNFSTVRLYVNEIRYINKTNFSFWSFRVAEKEKMKKRNISVHANNLMKSAQSQPFLFASSKFSIQYFSSSQIEKKVNLFAHALSEQFQTHKLRMFKVKKTYIYSNSIWAILSTFK